MKKLFISPLLIGGLLSTPLVITAAWGESKSWKEAEQITKASNLSPADKIIRLQGYLTPNETRWTRFLYFMNQVDRGLARDTMLKLFRKSTTPRQRRLEIGKYLITRNKDAGFLKEYSNFLVLAVINGGEEEFMKVREEGTITAVGEYAYMASGFEGYGKKDFESILDEKVIPILIRCLNAPDEIYGPPEGDLIRGEQGKPTGRDTGRQQIPIALARLKAGKAQKTLREIMLTHNDINLRKHSAYALGILADKEDIDAIEREIKEMSEPNVWIPIIYEYGKGLVERGDERGLKYMTSYFWGQRSDSPSGALYYIAERVRVLRGVRNPRLKNIYIEMLINEPFVTLLLFDPTKIPEPEFVPGGTSMSPQEVILKNLEGTIIETHTTIIDELLANNLLDYSVVFQLEKIIKNTKRPEIKQISQRYLDAYKSNPNKN